MLLAIKAWAAEHRGLAHRPRRSHQARFATARVPHRRRRAGARQGHRRRLGRRAGPALHGSQASQSPRACPRAPARGDHRRLHRHDLRRHAPEIEARRKAFIRKGAQAPRRRRQPGGSRRSAVHLARLPPSQWRSARTTKRSALHRSSNEDQNADRAPSADTAAMLFWRCLPPARSTCARSMAADARHKPIDQPMTSQPETIPSCYPRSRHAEFQPHHGRHLTAQRSCERRSLGKAGR